jgi:5-oxoprolinase (ATP-hydrolysing)
MSDGDVYLANDPYAGGSHLPDVTVVTPIFCAAEGPKPEPTGRPDFFVASRAHHSEIGGKTPGSMPPDAKNLAEEGVVITSFALCRDGHEYIDELRHLLGSGRYPSRNPEVNIADITAQRAAGIAGAARVAELVATYGITLVDACTRRMLDQAAQSVGRWIETLGDHTREFQDTLDDGTRIRVALSPAGGRLRIDFTGTSPVHPGCFNATPAIVTAATLYVIRTLIGGNLPMNGGITSRIDFVIPTGLLNPPRGETPDRCAAVVAGNVETSMRLVDVLLGALGVAAASQGTMNNVLIGDSSFGYYETIGGGSGATESADGGSGVHCHMTNTRITDPEIYESRYPVRLWRFAIRRDSGGNGKHRGGDGLVREIEFLCPLTVSLITNRRGEQRPWGIAGGEPGSSGRNTLITADGNRRDLPPATTLNVLAGDRLRIETPGGGGYGTA